MPAPTITTLALSSTANPPYVSRRRERNARATQGEQEARSTSGEDLPCPQTSYANPLTVVAHYASLSYKRNNYHTLAGESSTFARFSSGAWCSQQNPPCGFHRPPASNSTFVRPACLLNHRPRVFSLKSGRRAAARSTFSRLGLPPFYLSSKRKGGEVPPNSLKTTCLRSPLSRFVPTRRPGPRPSGRSAPGRVSRRRSRCRPRGRRLCSSDRRRARRRLPA